MSNQCINFFISYFSLVPETLANFYRGYFLAHPVDLSIDVPCAGLCHPTITWLHSKLKSYSTTLTCRHFAGILVIIVAGSVLEAVSCISNTFGIFVGFTSTPPAVGRRVAVQPVGGPGRCGRRFVQRKPVVVARPGVHTDKILCHHYLQYNTFTAIITSAEHVTF